MALTKVRGAGLGTLGDGTANDTKIVFDGNAQDYHIGLDDSADSLIIGKGSALGTTTSMVFDANGIITKPLQAAFHIDGTCVSHSGGAETAVVYASTPTIKMNIGNHGVGGTDASTSGKFTCPVDGIYFFSCRWYRGNTDSPTRYMGTNVKKNGTAFLSYWYTNAAGTSSFGDQSIAQAGIIQCSANDVLQQYVYSHSSDADPVTTMQIYLLG